MKKAVLLGFLAWTTSGGTLNFTDDPTRVPPMYRGAAVERTWDSVQARITYAVSNPFPDPSERRQHRKPRTQAHSHPH